MLCSLGRGVGSNTLHNPYPIGFDGVEILRVVRIATPRERTLTYILAVLVIVLHVYHVFRDLL
jgi:hypothetical protein